MPPSPPQLVRIWFLLKNSSFPPVLILFDHPIAVAGLSIEHQAKTQCAARLSSDVNKVAAPARDGTRRGPRLPLALAAHEVEVATFVGLQDGLVEEMRVTA